MSWLLIARAVDEDGSHAQARVEHEKLPTGEDLEHAKDAVRELFRGGFGREPSHVAAGALPWVEELDRAVEED